MRKEKRSKRCRKKLPFKRDPAIFEHLLWEVKDLMVKGTQPFEAIMEVHTRHASDDIDMDDLIDCLDEEVKKKILVSFYEAGKHSYFTPADLKRMKMLLRMEAI